MRSPGAAGERGSGVSPRPAKPSDAPLPSCLDQTIRDQLGAELKPRGVQKRDFRKDNKLVLVAHGGLYGGDMTSSSWIAGGSLGYFFTEDLGIQAEFDVTPLTLDLDAPLTKFFGDNRFEPGMAYIALGNLMWSPIHAKLKMGGGIVHADIMLFAGGGRMFHDAVPGLSFDAGFALDLFVTRVADDPDRHARPDGRRGDRRRDPLHQQPRRDRRARAVDPDGAVMRSLTVAALLVALPPRVADDGDRPIDKKQVAKTDRPASQQRARSASRDDRDVHRPGDRRPARDQAQAARRGGSAVREAGPPRAHRRRRLLRERSAVGDVAGGRLVHLST